MARATLKLDERAVFPAKDQKKNSGKESEKRPNQRDVRRAGREQPDRQGELRALAKGMEQVSHAREHPAILAPESRGFFFPKFTSR
jgi:hypothetical protein